MCLLGCPLVQSPVSGVRRSRVQVPVPAGGGRGVGTGPETWMLVLLPLVLTKVSTAAWPCTVALIGTSCLAQMLITLHGAGPSLRLMFCPHPVFPVAPR